jgi:hypothetical protein
LTFFLPHSFCVFNIITRSKKVNIAIGVMKEASDGEGEKLGEQTLLASLVHSQKLLGEPGRVVAQTSMLALI